MRIFLIGPMGAGKTTVGRQLAKRLRIPFVDSDQELERRTGVGIPLIFDIEGEQGFRDREELVIEELTQTPSIVLATGGGAVLRDSNRTALQERGQVVYLQASIEATLARTRRDRGRPLLQTADPRERLTKLLSEREPLYRQTADLIVDTDKRTVRSIVREIRAGLGV
jgi:shikimate kinase